MTRSFIQSDLGLLTSATNPENGTVTYTYNSDNTLQDKHDAKGQDTVYTYDSQKRVTEVQHFPYGKSYAEDACQQVLYTYGTDASQYNYGRLAAVQYNLCVAQANPTSFVESYAYHPAGAMTGKSLQVTRTEYDPNDFYPPAQATASVGVTYTYNSSGQVSTAAYPAFSGTTAPDTFTYSYDAMGRPVSLADDGTQGWSPPMTWVQSTAYDFAGRLSSWQHYARNQIDNVPTNYVTENETYNVNGQLSGINWSVQWSGSTLDSWGEQYVYSATQNNGQITQMVDVLTCSFCTGTPGETVTYQYDGFGNMTSKTLNGTATATLTVNTATNQLANASYDLNGNMTSGAGATMTYDELNRVASAHEPSGGTEYYGYAPDNKRIYRLEADGQTEEFTLYGAKGERLAVYSLVEAPQGWPPTVAFWPLRGTVWFAGKRVWEDNGGAVYQNRLGSNRAGARFYPYGEEITSTGNDRTKFATYNRDLFTGFDYADQRFLCE